MNAVMEACVRCGDLDSAMKVFDEMSKRDGCGVDRVSYGILLKGYTNTDFPLGALTIRDEILRSGLKPDKTTYNTLIYACIKSGKTNAAIQFLAEMKVSSKWLEGQKKLSRPTAMISFQML
ncbi:putative pentatricopeptide repeat-containing protein [Iris pallida]|uniref:Pentatricopeptide repeat-containing protein n=1 Tax=Iris pallida TaxID=29817 RepID=A0AAX6DGN7_IRIPA|nr:putative pentatricopeptide repeat-containing protein [Iris pallida]